MATINIENTKNHLERNFAYAFMCANGYNPNDKMFWEIFKMAPSGERSWKVQRELLMQKYGKLLEMPDGFLSWEWNASQMKWQYKEAA